MEFYVIVMDDYDDFSYHTNINEAQGYLQDLKKAYPENQVEIEIRKLGRKPGHEIGPVWACEGVYDIVSGEVQQFARNWLWPSQLKLVNLGKGVRSRYIAVHLENEQNESVFVNKVKKHYKNIKFIKIDGYTVEIL